MHPMQTVIRRAAADDVTALAALAHRSFFDAYCATDDHAVIDEYCARHFTPERFAAILADHRSTLLVAPAEDGALAGYAQLTVSTPPRCVGGNAPVELVRLYLAREWIGRGLGAALMREAIAAAERLGGQTLWLGVYERNPRAIAFYERFGMRAVGTKPWEWGGEVFQDPVLERSIGARHLEGGVPEPLRP